MGEVPAAFRLFLTFNGHLRANATIKPSQSNSLIYIIIAFCLFTSNAVFAQFTKLYDFGGAPNGIRPFATPIAVGSFLYGTTSDGGANGFGVIYKSDVNGNVTIVYSYEDAQSYHSTLFYDGSVLFGTNSNGGDFSQGTIYKINTDGTGYTDIFSFNYPSTGGFPMSGLISDGTTLYGATQGGGTGNYGTVFKINKDGSGFTKLADFTGTTGGYAYGNLVSDGTFLYGAGREGGASSRGVIFKVKMDGTSSTTLLNFDGSNGAAPNGPLVYDGTMLWGVTQYGGPGNNGVLYSIAPDGTGYTQFVSFSNVTGYGIKGGLVSDGNWLYGQSLSGGTSFNGTIFKINLSGAAYTVLHSFTANGGGGGTLSEGTMTLVGSTLFGAQAGGGKSIRGGLFSINTSGASYTDLHSFEEIDSQPTSELLSDGTYFYGTTSTGGAYNWGTAYKVKMDGTGFQRLIDFDLTGIYGPRGAFTLIGSTLYGVTTSGGANGNGVIYKVNTNGTGLATVFDFEETTSGLSPSGTLIYDGTYFYGTTENSAPPNNYGTVFKIMPNGTNYTKLYTFNLFDTDGGYPQSNLLLDGGFLYGVTRQGGTAGGFGSVYKIKNDGTAFQQLVSFDANNGQSPVGALYSDGTYLYGTTSEGGATGNGTIFRVKKDGSGFETLKDLDETSGAGTSTALISDGTYLYGTTPYRGANDQGTIFKIKPDGSGFGKMTDFSDGEQPGKLYSDGTFLYGVTNQGGINDKGTLFKRSIAPATSISNFTPGDGPTGTYVTINGIDFDPAFANNVVQFDGVTAEILNGTSNELQVVVPDGASTGDISVTSNGITDNHPWCLQRNRRCGNVQRNHKDLQCYFRRW
ncbi:MAG: choice-of-anchor tandem repeat GloVer-containing protein [Bacteroidota bacterium]